MKKNRRELRSGRAVASSTKCFRAKSCAVERAPPARGCFGSSECTEAVLRHADLRGLNDRDPELRENEPAADLLSRRKAASFTRWRWPARTRLLFPRGRRWMRLQRMSHNEAQHHEKLYLCMRDREPKSSWTKNCASAPCGPSSGCWR